MQDVNERAVVVGRRSVTGFRSDGRVNGGVFGNCANSSVCVIPPVFADFDGRGWEHRYPELLDKYYSVLARFDKGTVCCDGEDVVCQACDADDGKRVGGCGKSYGSVIAGVASCGFGGSAGRCVADVAEPVVDSERSQCQFGSDTGGVGSVGLSGRRDSTSERSGGSDVVRAVKENVRLVGDDIRENGGVSEKTLFNRKRREQKKNRKLRKQQVSGVCVDVQDDRIPEWRRGARPVYRGAFGSCSDEVRKKLADTRAQRLIAENEASVREAQAKAESWAVSQKARRKRETLRTMQVDQKIELMRSVDVDQLKRRQQTRIMRDTEVNKVDVEKAHNSLIVTGNVPGFAETIISSGSISPSSSVSEAEVRKLHKENLDLKKQNADLVERLRGCKVGVDDDVPYSVGITVDEEGHPIGDFGDGYGGYIGTDGRFHTGINWAEYY